MEANKKKIQAAIREHNIHLGAFGNYDETSGQWSLHGRYTFAPIGGGGAAGGGHADERERITVLVFIFADGNHLPPSYIIKCSTDKVDQSASTVLAKLLDNPDFNTDKLWVKKTWERTMRVMVKRVSQDVGFKRHYLIHPDGRVVFAQHKAYQDTPGLAMWCDLVLGPARKQSGDPLWLLVWDNCSSHLVPSVLAVYEEWGIKVLQLSENMTDIEQPVDIVVCGPMKAHTKTDRTNQLYDYFQRYRGNCASAIATRRPRPKYDPPAPTVASFISLMSGIFAGRFSSEEFKDGVRRTFQAVGLAPYNAEGDYYVYDSHNCTRARLPRTFRGVVHKDLEALELLNDLALVPRPTEEEMEAAEQEEFQLYVNI